MVKCALKYGYLKSARLKEIGLCVEHMLNILGSIVDIIEYDDLTTIRIFTLTMTKTYI